MVFRIYVEKEPSYQTQNHFLHHELTSFVGVAAIQRVRVLHRYDVEGVSQRDFDDAVPIVFSQPGVDSVYTALPESDVAIKVQALAGQFDQRAYMMRQGLELMHGGTDVAVRCATVYLLDGDLSEKDVDTIKGYLINPVERETAPSEKPHTLKRSYPPAKPVAVLDGFNESDAAAVVQQYGLAMDAADVALCQRYFASQQRQPTLTELRMLDTYWSDHCRHTTFNTLLQEITIEDAAVQQSYNTYLQLRDDVYKGKKEKPITLMDMGTIGAKALKQQGKLKNLDESEEINACSVHIEVDNDGTDEPWLLLFKNETHNHPTEIEPFGGASTCLGGAIRDPLANRGYVHAAMRVSGAANPLARFNSTLPGKLPQRQLVQTAAKGYASYGNQIGVASAAVKEFYHPGYVAKRLEAGAVLGAVPLENVVRETPQPGDVVLLLGGKTGRDGIGGATGSSKTHEEESAESCAAEVQKGNAPLERSLQRLFRNPDACRLIRRCNDFGAGGVSVAIGELADGVHITLDNVPTKYSGLDGTELAISESQERMAVVIAADAVEAFKTYTEAENLTATAVAIITAEPRLVIDWRGDTIVNLERAFLNSNGADREAHAAVGTPSEKATATPQGDTLQRQMEWHLGDLRFCAQHGLAAAFDATAGGATTLMPFGGKYQQSPAQSLVTEIPVSTKTTTCAAMAYGFDPFLSEANPYEGGKTAVVSSVAKLIACGFTTDEMYLSFQEYFEGLRDEPYRWGKPVAALLGALQAQMDIGVAAVGGKDSMSGSFETLDVPPTLISFAVAKGSANKVISNHFEAPFSRLVWVRPEAGNGVTVTPFANTAKQVEQLIQSGAVLSARAVDGGGLAETLVLMGLGNRLGVDVSAPLTEQDWFAPAHGSFVLELAEPQDIGIKLGETTTAYHLKTDGETVALDAVEKAYHATLQPVYKSALADDKTDAVTATEPLSFDGGTARTAAIKTAKPTAVIPVVSGVNSEYELAKALRQAGAAVQTIGINHRQTKHINSGVRQLAAALANGQMLIMPSGFSATDETESSARLLAALFTRPVLREAVAVLLEKQDGLILGLGSGFNALLQLGLLPGDEVQLVRNAIGQHQSRLVRTQVSSTLSPWFSAMQPGDVHTVPFSHSEARLIADEAALDKLRQNGQIAAQYIDFEGRATTDAKHNPAGSALAIEALSSADGRVVGKAAHSERRGEGLYKNVAGNKFQPLFEGGVAYFTS